MRNFKILLFIVILMAGVLKAETAGKDTLQIETWLKTGVVNLSPPLFSCEKDINEDPWDLKDFLQTENIDVAGNFPAAGGKIEWDKNTTLNWQAGNAIVMESSDTTKPGTGYVAFYLETSEWQEFDLILKTTQLLKVWHNGREIGCKEDIQKTDEEPGTLNKKLELETGKHRILIKTVAGMGIENWTVSGQIAGETEPLNISLDPVDYMTVDKLLYSERAANVKISYDGEYTAITLSRADKATKKTEYWTDIRFTDSGELVRSLNGGMKISSLTWSPISNEFIYKTQDDGKTSLWRCNLENGKNIKILDSIENMGPFQWSPTGEYLIYSKYVEEEEEKSGVRKLKHMPDRQPANRRVAYLYKLNLGQGTTEQLTYGKLSTNLYDISENGKRLIVSRYHPFKTERPFSLNDFYILNIETMQLDSLFALKWANSLQWSPDGEKILITGGVSMFDGIGKNLPADITPNDYDSQAFIYYLNSGKVFPVTKNFNPAIKTAAWSKINNNIYFVAEDRSWVNLYEYDVEKNNFMKLNTGLEVVNRFDLADQANSCVYFGSGAATPFQVYSMTLGRKSLFGKKEAEYQLIYSPAKEVYQKTELSEVKRWTFTNKDGVEIEGRYYLPPNFDPSKKYPCIVYYYGGTSPVSRDFDGRYPKNYWAANGYVVYVLQPSGSTGFGQEFAAKHVNEWGSIVPEEIIMGTKKFVAAHEFVDRDRLGCIGASYGGFTTESLITKTDMFAAAVSHAGISAVPSYWGEGYWGYSYGAVANANTFPWSHPEVFMKNSALYNADKINTPLLMTHGTSDTNVPPGESIQLYTALKLLGKEVELLECKGQNHFVLEYGQREKWSKSIVAWFDKHLKKDSDWWDHLYK